MKNLKLNSKNFVIVNNKDSLKNKEHTITDPTLLNPKNIISNASDADPTSSPNQYSKNSLQKTNNAKIRHKSFMADHSNLNSEIRSILKKNKISNHESVESAILNNRDYKNYAAPLSFQNSTHRQTEQDQDYGMNINKFRWEQCMSKGRQFPNNIAQQFNDQDKMKNLIKIPKYP